MAAITIRDAESGAAAQVLPEYGCNCCSFRPVVDGQEIETLWAEPGFAPGHRPSRSGIPILFPFAGRLRGRSFRYAGRDYALRDVQFNGENAIHGFVLGRPWRVVEQARDRLAATFQLSVDAPALAPQWPADFRITAAYRVFGATLRAAYTVENPDERPLPFGFGIHPYFRVPLGGTSTADCIVRVPAAAMAPTDDALPTGETVHIDAARDLRAGVRYGDLTLDDILTGLAGSGGRVATSIHDPGSGRTLTQTFDADFPYGVVFTPPHREAIAVEPYTTLPNAFELTEAGVDAGLRTLAPGETWTGRVEITLS